MAQFQYTALNQDNSYQKGTIDARSVKAATVALEQQKMIVINIQRIEHPRFMWLQVVLNGISAQDRIFITRNLHTMLQAGIGLDRAVKTTAEQVTNVKLRQTLEEIWGQLQQGQAFHKALAKYPQYFSPFFTNLVRVGESSGKLDEILQSLLEKQERDAVLRTKVRSAMIYPCIIIGALVVMIAIMMLFVIPRVTGVLTSYNVTLPLATRILIAISNFFVHQWYILVLALVVVTFGFRAWVRSKRGGLQWDTFILRLPLLKTIIQEFNLAIFVRSLSALLHSGVQLDQAMTLAGSSCSQKPYQEATKLGVRFVQKGVPLSEVLKGSPRLFPPLTLRMVEVGEQTGKLDTMLRRLANVYEESVQTALTNLSSTVEPILLLTVGLTVGFVAIAVLTPIWKFSSTI